MSDPKRYSRRDIYDVTYQAAGDECLPEPSENGEFVRWEDYAALLATNERVCQRFAKTQVEANEAEAEVERYKFTLEEERQIARQDWAGLRCEHDRVKRALENAEAEVERLRSLFANSEWQSIETAPLDGTDILCFCVEPEFAGEENPWTEFRVCFYGMLNEGESCWMSHYGYEQRPTHWMPLPKPPTR